MFSRYQTASGVEGEYQPGSRGRVLRNKLGIKSKREIDQKEYELLLCAQQKYIRIITTSTQFTAQLLCEMHREWLGELYEWAGRYRTVELAKGDFRWPPAHLVPQHMQDFESTLLQRYTPCLPAPAETVCEHIAIVHAELLLIHPFRDGNGRLARWLADLMALQAGYSAFNYRFIGRGAPLRRATYIEAVSQGYLQNYRPLTDFFLAALR